MPKSDEGFSRERTAYSARTTRTLILKAEDAPHPQLMRILGEAAKVASEQAERRVARERRIAETQPPDVQRVAHLAGGRSVVVIGGRPSLRAVENLEAFGCMVNWLSSKPHDPPMLFKPHIIKPEVVLLLIR